MRRVLQRYLFIAGLMLAAVPSLAAQQASEAQRCAIAIEIVRTGDSRHFTREATGYPDEYKMRWAYSWIRGCGARGGAALARRLSLSANSRDTAWLRLISNPSRTLMDGAVFQAAARLATNPAATEESRVFALRTLMWAIEPRLSISYGSITTWRCTTGVTFHSDTLEGAPLPGNRRQQVAAVATRILESGQVPDPVGAAARCARIEAVRLPL
jgi:hypothetical protein